ncbi:MAG TPA: hypothetical protein VGW36_03775 [Pyrinomonadaceae bacterium]|nr:hypothetical protein [Pyrinomonadaceae bacterium]
MLVVGDSILWGQGLVTEQKTWFRLKCWLQEKTGREVKERIEAHSGALISGVSPAEKLFESRDGEVNLPYPTVIEQVDHARSFYAQDTGLVNLVLANGCINDVDVARLLNGGTSPGAVSEAVSARCGNDMQQLLRRITENFPNAYVLVPGYFPIVSTKTEDNAFIRLLAKKLASGSPDARRLSDKELRMRLIALSNLWYNASTSSLSEAVRSVNAELIERSLSPRIRFVEIDFGPEHSFAAADSLLWSFIFNSTNLSGFRKIIVALSFGTDAYKPNDDVRESRIKSCKATFKERKDRKETKAEKQYRKDKLLICRYASLGHPNQMGALIYAEAMKGQLLSLIDQAGWRRAL